MKLSRGAQESIRDIANEDGTVDCNRLKGRIYSLDHRNEVGIADELTEWTESQGHPFGDACDRSRY